MGGERYAKAIRKERQSKDPRVFHAVCDHCGNYWTWQGAHRSKNQRCPECGSHPAAATYFEDNAVIRVPRAQFKDLPPYIPEPAPPDSLSWGISLLHAILGALEPPVFVPLEVMAIGYYSAADYRVDLEREFEEHTAPRPVAWAPISELLDRTGISSTKLEQAVAEQGFKEAYFALADKLEPALESAFALCLRRVTGAWGRETL